MTQQTGNGEEDICNRFKIDLEHLNEFSFREQRADIQSSVMLLGQRTVRQYMSEFILPDDTRIGVRRQESSQPVDQTQVVVVSLSVCHPYNSLLPVFGQSFAEDSMSDSGSLKTLETSEDATDTDDEMDLHRVSMQRYSLGCTQFISLLD